jgi:hypothetical protein
MKIGCSRQVFEVSSKTKFRENPFIGRPVIPRGWADGRMGGRTDRQTESCDEGKSRFSQF